MEKMGTYGRDALIGRVKAYQARSHDGNITITSDTYARSTYSITGHASRDAGLAGVGRKVFLYESLRHALAVQYIKSLAPWHASPFIA